LGLTVIRKFKKNRDKKEKNAEKRKDSLEVMSLIPYQQCNKSMKTEERIGEDNLCILH
jgi:hypothetical protein